MFSISRSARGVRGCGSHLVAQILVGSPRATFLSQDFPKQQETPCPDLWELSLPPSKGSGVFPKRGLGFAVIQAPQTPFCTWGKHSEPKPAPSSPRLLGQTRVLLHRSGVCCVLLHETREYPCRSAGRRRARSPPLAEIPASPPAAASCCRELAASEMFNSRKLELRFNWLQKGVLKGKHEHHQAQEARI